MAKRSGIMSVVLINLAVVVGLLALVELGLYILMSRTAPTGIGPLDKLAQQIYWSRVSLIQYDADCAQYDPELSYTLRPGTCAFANEGFLTAVGINSAGLRDDERALVAPAIIVTGDSHAMGWGVEQDDTFAEFIQIGTGQATLNAGISSYGTVREVEMLKRLDLSGLRTLVVQYSDNDWWENRTYLENDLKLPIQDQESYARNVDENPDFRYFPGANLRDAIKLILARFAPPDTEDAPAPATATKGMNTADMFLRVLASGDFPSDGVHLVLLEVNTHGRGDGSFIENAEGSAELAALRDRFKAVSFIKTHEFLGPEDRQFPDGHMTLSGHKKVAEAILQSMAGIPEDLASEGASQ